MRIAKAIEQKSNNFQQVVDACHYLLENSPLSAHTKSYLDSRLPQHVQDEYEFGFFPLDDGLEHLFALVDKSILEQLLILYPRYISGGKILHGHFSRHNLIMPFRDAHDNIIGLLGRTILSEEEQEKEALQKYKYSYGSCKNLHTFGLYKAKQSIIEKDFVIGVEGQFDCIALQSNGITNTVGFGSANISRYQLFQLHRYTNNIILLFDNDKAGINAKRRLKHLYSPYANIITMGIPGKLKDVDAFLRKTSDIDKKEEFLEFLRRPYASWPARTT